MKIFQIRQFQLRRTIAWFPNRLRWYDALSLLDVRQGGVETRSIFFRQQQFNTELIDLSHSIEDISAGFGKDNLYEIRRAAREGIKFICECDRLQFVNLYQRFAASKSGRDELKLADLMLYDDSVAFTYARLDGDVLVGHCYFLDDNAGIVRLLHSASDFRASADKKRRALIGRANRFLHARDVEYFKNQGFRTYDIGGVYVGKDDEEKHRIAEFKHSFGGVPVAFINSQSWPLVMATYIKKLFNASS